ncbi:hypothetical protein AC622_10910 [Bacillus sp. FJAT-27916]|uniref:hypothetical protein n=1 Tax=Bacillus sp. FJAT-27916 TaxID=1679169 RepID=UPI0006713223|nr:hypothetical protein [Bacillus sp. FJAT-27916]KMY44690.1 hypothetical protein AC622_10910 [Bacillus sp. FJAT-27916]
MTLKIVSYISNYIPEFGYSTAEEREFLPINHPDAKRAAQKALDYDNHIYLPGYIEMTYEDKVFLSSSEGTEDMLFTWWDIIWYLHHFDEEIEYDITLLDNIATLFIMKKETDFYIVLDSYPIEAPQNIRTMVIPQRNFIDVMISAFKEFLIFCKSGLIFNEESQFKSVIELEGKLNSI